MEIDLLGFGVVLYIHLRQAIAGLLRSIWLGRPILSCNDLGTFGKELSSGFYSRMEIYLFGFGVVLYIDFRQAIAGLLRSIWFGRPILSFNDQGTTDTGFSNGFDSRMGIYLLGFGVVLYNTLNKSLQV